MWDKIKWYVQKFMVGRNGRDELQVAVLYGAFIFYAVVSIFTKSVPYVAFVITWVAVFYSLFRFCSKDVHRRREENQKFLREIEFFKLRISMRKTHKIYRCKGCGRKIRVPRGKGKIEITCPLCNRKFIRRT